jgi:anti-sigma B factor antagonist
MDGEFAAEVIHLDGDGVLMVTGEIDASTSPKLHDACLRLTSVTDRLVLDFAGVTFMDSSGLHVLIQIHQREDTSRVAVRNAPRRIERLFEVTGLTAQFLDPPPSATDVAEASITGTGHVEASER